MRARVELVGRSEAASIVGVSPNRFDQYWRRHPDLVRAARRVIVTPGTSGRRKWVRADLERHVSEVCI